MAARQEETTTIFLWEVDASNIQLSCRVQGFLPEAVLVELCFPTGIAMLRCLFSMAVIAFSKR